MKASRQAQASSWPPFASRGAYRFVFYGLNMALLASTVAIMEWQHRDSETVTKRLGSYHLTTVISTTAVREEMHVLEHSLAEIEAELPARAIEGGTFVIAHPEVATALYLANAGIEKITATQTVFQGIDFEEQTQRIERQYDVLERSFSSGFQSKSEVGVVRQQLKALVLSLVQLGRLHTSEHDRLTSLLPLQSQRRLHTLIATVLSLFAISLVVTRRIIKSSEEYLEALRLSESRYRQLVECSPYCIHEIDLDGNLTAMNRSGLKMLGLSNEQEIMGAPYLGAVAKCDSGRVASLMSDAFAGHISFFEFQGQQNQIFASSFVPLKKKNGSISGLMGITQDISERKRNERELLDYQTNLQSLANELCHTEEQERRNIATTLHDGIGQTLIFAKMRLGLLTRTELTNQAQTITSELVDSLDQAIQEVRELMFELNPPMLTQLGLVPTLQWLCEEMSAKHKIKIELVDHDASLPLEETERGLLFQAIRELLINAVKHAHASKIQVAVNVNQAQFSIHVEDDGIGFDENTSQKGFGLFNIRERLRAINGSIEIGSRQGKGTRASITAPLKTTAAC